MGVFLVVHGNKNRINECLEPSKLISYDDSLHIEYENRQIAKSNNGLFAFIHYERSDSLYSAESQTYIHKENQKLSITLLQGYLWEKVGTDGVIEAHKLHTMINTHGCEKVRDHCNGEYSTIHYNESNNSLYVFNDRMGMESLYYYKDNTQLIISNRVRLIREVLQKSSPDIETLNWIIAVGIIVGEGTSEKGVSRLPQAAYLSVKNNRIDIHENNVFMIDVEFNKTLHEYCNVRSFPFSLFKKNKNSIDSIIDEAIEECAINIEICLKHAPKTLIPLSGGKDSRAVLALSNYKGKKENINIFTNGFSEHADVMVAQEICNHMNLDLQVNIPKPPVEVSDDWVFDRMMGHSFQTDGLHGSWDAKGYTATSGGLRLTGHIGEVYRSNYNKNNNIDLSSVHTASKMFQSANIFDKAGFLNLSAKKYYESKLEERMGFYLDNGSELSDLPDIIYSMERVPNWIASLRRTDGYSARLVSPLSTETFIKLAFFLGADQRRMDRIHFEIINRVDPWLASYKFADDCWHSGLQQYAKETKLATKMVKTPAGLPRFGSWQYQLRDSASLRDKFLDVFTAYPQSPMWDYCDKKIVEEKFKKGLFETTFELLSAYGFINTFFYAHEIELPMKLRTIPK